MNNIPILPNYEAFYLQAVRATALLQEETVINWDPIIGWIILIILGGGLWRLIKKADDVQEFFNKRNRTDSNDADEYTSDNTSGYGTTVNSQFEPYILLKNGARVAPYPTILSATERIRSEVGLYNIGQIEECDDNGNIYTIRQIPRSSGSGFGKSRSFTVVTYKVYLNSDLANEMLSSDTYEIVSNTR